MFGDITSIVVPPEMQQHLVMHACDASQMNDTQKQGRSALIPKSKRNLCWTPNLINKFADSRHETRHKKLQPIHTTACSKPLAWQQTIFQIQLYRTTRFQRVHCAKYPRSAHRNLTRFARKRTDIRCAYSAGGNSVRENQQRSLSG